MAANVPQEIVESFMHYVYYNDRQQPDQATLSACSTLCKAWSGPAQRLLFYSVRWNTAQAMTLISLPNPHTQSLLSSIRCLDLDISIGNTDAVADFIAVIAHCMGLYELVLRFSRLHALGDAAVEELRRLAERPEARPLRALRLPSFGIQSPVVYQFLQIWPSIQFLRLGQELAAPHPRTWAPQFHLYELTLLRVHTRNVAAIEWLLSASVGHLRILHLRDEPGTSYNEIFQVHGPYLESLRLYNHNKRTGTLLRMCPKLKEFSITLLSSFIPLDGIPPTLEHLSFRNYDWATNESLYPIINALDGLPRLRLITCDPNGTSHPHWGTLRDQCTRRGIILKADAPPIYVVSASSHVRDAAELIGHRSSKMLSLLTDSLERSQWTTSQS